jgi:hypothetical protein
MDNLRAGPTDPPMWALGGGARGASKKILLQRRKKKYHVGLFLVFIASKIEC